MDLISIRKQVDEITEKGLSEGVTLDDFKVLKDLKKELYESDNALEAMDIWHDISDILTQMYDSGLAKRFNDSNMKYILGHIDLLPLVLACKPNATIVFRGKNSIALPFKFEATDSDNNLLVVEDANNRFSCTNSGINGNASDYLRAVEGINIGQAFELLCHIFNFPLRFAHPNIQELAPIYKEAIKSERYLEILKELEQRLYDKCIEKQNGIPVDKIYERKRELRERIINDGYDMNFKYERPPRIIILKPKETKK